MLHPCSGDRGSKPTSRSQGAGGERPQAERRAPPGPAPRSRWASGCFGLKTVELGASGGPPSTARLLSSPGHPNPEGRMRQAPATCRNALGLVSSQPLRRCPTLRGDGTPAWNGLPVPFTFRPSLKAKIKPSLSLPGSRPGLLRPHSVSVPGAQSCIRPCGERLHQVPVLERARISTERTPPSGN